MRTKVILTALITACISACGGSEAPYEVGEASLGRAVKCGRTICGANQYCFSGKEQCSARDGVCRDIPNACPAVVDPVCGCDGETYDNACYAAASGVNVASEGACDGGIGIGLSSDTAESTSRIGRALCGKDRCGIGEYCDRVTCGSEDGVCRARPQECYEVYAPVCGCDGRTYDNNCVAARRGVDVDTLGACK